MSYHARRILTPGPSRKRKEREAFYGSTSPKPSSPVTAVSLGTTSSKGTELQPPPQQQPQPQPLSSNRLLAGYMAYEFLTKGTLLGQKFDPARAEAVPLNAADLKKNKPISEAEPSRKSKPQSYAEVADLMMSDGAHIPGIVNPTQLTRWIQM